LRLLPRRAIISCLVRERDQQARGPQLSGCTALDILYWPRRVGYHIDRAAVRVKYKGLFSLSLVIIALLSSLLIAIKDLVLSKKGGKNNYEAS
jgi:hypothetical protein